MRTSWKAPRRQLTELLNELLEEQLGSREPFRILVLVCGNQGLT